MGFLQREATGQWQRLTFSILWSQFASTKQATTLCDLQAFSQMDPSGTRFRCLFNIRQFVMVYLTRTGYVIRKGLTSGCSRRSPNFLLSSGKQTLVAMTCIERGLEYQEKIKDQSTRSLRK